MKKYRYPGASPFTAEQQHLFFGRDKEKQQLFQLVQQEQLVVLYSKSGLGKSSLLNAGLIPEIQKEGSYEPIKIRFGAWFEGKEEMPLDILDTTILDGWEKNCFLDSLIPQENSLWYAVKKRQINGGSPRILFLFDQFEELFTYPEKAILNFKQELNELLKTSIPKRVRRMIDLLSASQPDLLSEEEEALLYKGVDVKVLFAIRSDRLHLVDKLSDYLPNILRNNYELKALRPADARSAIIQPALEKGDFVTPPFTYDPAAIDKILDFLQDEEERVEAIQLQLLCQTFEHKLEKEERSRITEDDTKDLELIISNFYHDKINNLETEAERQAARELIEEGLILEEDEQRLTLHQGQIAKFFDVPQVLLTKLVDAHLLRAEPSHRGGYTYELSHDTLIHPVLEAKQSRRAAEEKKAAEAAKVQREKEMEELRKKAKEERKRREKQEELRKDAVIARREAVASARRAKRWAVIGFVLGAVVAVSSYFIYSGAKEYYEEKAVRAEAEIKEKTDSLTQLTLVAQQKDSLARKNEEKADSIANIAQQEVAIAKNEITQAKAEKVQVSKALAKVSREKEQVEQSAAQSYENQRRLEADRNRYENQIADLQSRIQEIQNTKITTSGKEDLQYQQMIDSLNRRIRQLEGQNASLKPMENRIDSLENVIRTLKNK